MNHSSKIAGFMLIGFAGLILLRHPGYVVGTVIDEGGRGIAGVDVNLVNECSVTSGADGHFAMLAVEHGEYILRAKTPGFEPFQDTVIVKAEDTLHLAITMTSPLTQVQRDSARAGLLTLLLLQPDLPSGQVRWQKECH